ncbi:MAG: glycoside hydrolase family 2 TIM barrel-domain containing protein [Ruthenibacterium sp.]
MKREKIMLAKDWKFYLGDQVAAYYKGFDDSAWKTVCVPHDWAVEQPFSKENSSGTGYLPGGVGWYRTHFVLPEKTNGKKVVLNFGGVYNNSQVWCNSNNLGKRPNGYSSFAYDITEFVQPGDNVISVCVRHEHTADSRWYTGSGIYRPTYLEIMDACCFTRHGVFISTKNADKKSALLQVEWSTNASSVCAEFNLLDEHGNVVFCGLEQEGKTAIVTVPSPGLWSPDSPKLYTLRARLLCDTKCCDEIEIPFGIRTFQFDAENGFFLNNIPMKLKGVCLHHDAGVLGAAVPQNVWRRRLQKLKEMGCNAIRTSHNPPDVALLDLCDSMGFLVMDEAFDEWEGCKNKWWQGHNVYPPKRFGYAADFPVWHEADLQEMVCRDRNHPSIILWSIGNEIDYPNDPYCSPLFQTTTGNNDKNKPAAERQYDPNKPDAKRLGSIARELYAIVKQYDTTRPVTAAIAFPEISNQVGYTDALDVVGYNYKEHLYEQDCATYKNRVIYGSENGHTVQAWAAVKEHQNICGQFLWAGLCAWLRLDY